jgi:hypothetical protein
MKYYSYKTMGFIQIVRGLRWLLRKKFFLTEAQNADLYDKSLMQIPLVISTAKYPEVHSLIYFV